MESPRASFNGFRLSLWAGVGFVIFGIGAIFSFFFFLKREEPVTPVHITLQGYHFVFPSQDIRAHALKNNETEEVTIRIHSPLEVQTTAALKFKPLKTTVKEEVTVVLRPALEEISPEERVKILYPRFLTGAPFAGPEGLTGRVFLPQSAYDGEVLFTGKNGFAARCEQAISTETGEYCLRELRLGEGKIEATIRFPRALLGEWQELDKNIIAELEKARE